MGVTAEALAERYENLLELHYEHEGDTARLQTRSLDELLPALTEELQLDEQEVERARAFLKDDLTIWRFLRRARFDEEAALGLLRNTLKWRLSASLDLLSAGALDPLYTDNPVFFFHPGVVDRFGRPAAILTLKHVKRTADGTLNALKEYIALGCEVGRRYLTELSKKKGENEDPVLQLILLVDLAGAGMSNLEIELLPFLLDLLKSHFPSMAGAMLILNFGWAYAGMWAVAKRVMPQAALDRILFPSKEELLHFFEEDSLLKDHGGNIKYRYAFKGSVLSRLGRPAYFASPSASKANSPIGSKTPSRASSYDSIADVFHSMNASPRSSRPGTPSGARHSPYLSMTSLQSAVEANEKKPDARPLRRRASSQDFHNYPLGADVAENSTDSEIEGQEETQRRLTRRRSAQASQTSSAAVSRDPSPRRRRSASNSAENSPIVGTSAIPKIHINSTSPERPSPYSAANPTWGYRPSGDGRRRKRDLIRSLSYLFFLRLLALRRSIESELAFLFDFVIRKLRQLGVLRTPPAPPPVIEERPTRRGKRRKAVKFDIIEELDEDEPQPKSRKRRMTNAMRASSPARSGVPAAGSNSAGLRVALTLLALVLLFRSGRIVCWLRAGEPGGRRARFRAALSVLWPS